MLNGAFLWDIKNELFKHMRQFYTLFVSLFLVATLSACGLLRGNPEKKNQEDKSQEDQIQIDSITERPPLEFNIVTETLNNDILEEINKLEQRLAVRLDKLEALIKNNLVKKTRKPTAKTVVRQPSETQGSKVVVVGEVEWVYVHELSQSFKTRIDSGANTSSISASNIQPFERDGKNWVRFTVDHRDIEKTEVIEAPVVRKVRIKQASNSESQRRLVVSLNINLGEKLTENAEFTLADRSRMTYPILLGREFLQDITLIDVGEKFLHPKFKPETNK